MEGYEKGDNAAIWSAVNNIASMVKKLDPNHPTMTVIAEIGGDKVKNVHRLCPDIDVVGINSYGGAATIPQRYRKAGGLKPYVLTEFGPPGAWESPKTSWGAAIEPSSTAKAEAYRRVYQLAVRGAEGLCLGSYAFALGPQAGGDRDLVRAVPARWQSHRCGRCADSTLDWESVREPLPDDRPIDT